MGAFLFSNKSIATERIVDVFKTRGHKNIKCETEIGMTLVHAPKILVENVNYLCGTELGGSNEDFIVGVGVYFYNGTTREAALKKVYQNLDEVLNKNPVYGHWAFVVHKNNTTYVLNDMTGSFRLYYWQNGNNIVVSSSMLAVVASMDKPKIDHVRLAGFVVSKYASQIPFVEGVNLINPLKYLKMIDGKDVEWINKTLPEVKRIETTEEAAEYVKSLFEDQVKQLKAIGDEKVSAELTAGLDSRLISSVLKSNGFNFSFLHFPLYGPDKEVAYKVAKGVNKEIELQTDAQNPKDYKEFYGEFEYGFNFFNHHANPRRKIKNQLQFTGAIGEFIDLPEFYSDEFVEFMNNPKLEVLLARLTYMPFHKLMDKQMQESWMSYIVNYFKSYHIKEGVNLTEREQMEFYWLLCVLLMASRTLSAYESHNDRYSIFSEWHFNYFVRDIAFSAKEGRKLTLALIPMFDEELASYPFISRLVTGRGSVKDTKELPIQYKHHGAIKKKLPNWFIDLYYRKRGYVFDKALYKDVDFKKYEDILNVRELKKYPGLYKDALERLYSVEVIRKIMNIEV